MNNRKKRPQGADNQHSLFIAHVVQQLRAQPSKVNIIKRNLEEYRQQRFLKRGFLTAIERFDWVFEASDNIEDICQQILADDYIGKRLRRYPLLFKGIVKSD
ncbi:MULTISPECIES: hypothetical protein [Pseudoalteromonas]|nr:MULTISPECIES: hypothetical protein [Pseudoalteromonas]MCF6146844.1 hypothetical protein [Pseudoalteromonas mariniglutinosa NCIMB 1770]TMN73299.1 hypothetical protein CWB85_04070 [Pseudoalteromonas sp. S1727]